MEGRRSRSRSPPPSRPFDGANSEAGPPAGFSPATFEEPEEEVLARWPPRGFRDAADVGAPGVRIHTGESDDGEPDDDGDAEFLSVDEESESVGLEERVRWEAARAALLNGWAAVTAETLRRRGLWDLEKAAEDAVERRRLDSEAAFWTPAEQALARKESAAVAQAAAAERTRWRAFEESVCQAVKAAILTPAPRLSPGDV